MGALVSIIVPIYNLEGYADNCLRSLVNQTYHNLEILCIDDGSTDKSAEVIKSFADKDDRVIYVYKENGGVSSARNLGLDMFKGDYVMFVDGDDYLHPQAVELFVDCIEKTECDIACADSIKIDFVVSEFPQITQNSFELIDVKVLYSNAGERSFAAVWSKIYRSKVLNRFRFPLGIKYGEDTNFLLKVLGENPKLAKIYSKVYYYYSREMSAETSPFGLDKVTVLDSYDDICEYFNKKEGSDLKSFVFQYLFQTICYIRTMCIGSKYEKNVVEKCKNLGNKWIGVFLGLDHLKFKSKIITISFFYFHFLYELVRIIIDPTMLDFYKNRRKHKGKSQKD